MTKNIEELNTSPERVQKTPVNEHELPVVAWRYQTPTGWHALTDANRALRIDEHHSIEPLTTIAAATEAIEKAKLRPAPCARYCEAQAFNIELRQRDSYIESLERLLDSTFIAEQDKNLQHIAELEAVLKQARSVINEYANEAIQNGPGEPFYHACCGRYLADKPLEHATDCRATAALAAIDALGVK